MACDSPDNADASSVSSSPLRCNPAPPDELVDLGPDLVEGTAYSKAKILSTLMRLLKSLDGGGEDTAVDEEAQNDTPACLNISEDFQDELCQLWDMSADASVAKFLGDHLSVFTDVIVLSKSPRAIEIAIGILANMACSLPLTEHMDDDSSLVNVTIQLLLSSRDQPTLCEASRFLSTVLSCERTRERWECAIKEISEPVRETVEFVLQSSKNRDLLMNMATFVDVLFDRSERICQEWVTNGMDAVPGDSGSRSSTLLSAVLIAIDEIGHTSAEALSVYFHILQTFSTIATGVEALVVRSDAISEIFLAFINAVVDSEFATDVSCEVALTSLFSVLGVLLSAGCSEIMEVFAPMRCALHVLDEHGSCSAFTRQPPAEGQRTDGPASQSADKGEGLSAAAEPSSTALGEPWSGGNRHECRAGCESPGAELASNRATNDELAKPSTPLSVDMGRSLLYQAASDFLNEIVKAALRELQVLREHSSQASRNTSADSTRCAKLTNCSTATSGSHVSAATVMLRYLDKECSRLQLQHISEILAPELKVALITASRTCGLGQLASRLADA